MNKLMAVLENKLGNHKQAREYSKIAYELCDKDYPLWVANNEGNFVYSIDEENKKNLFLPLVTFKNSSPTDMHPQILEQFINDHKSRY